MVQKLLYFCDDPEKTFPGFAKTISIILSYLPYMLKTTIGSSAFNTCILNTTIVYA
ncbi:hypothetical protein NJT12_19740 [Flavobacterium sp. AC]|uniref:Uncharacterized protein n=1 Tax=Flavobacterium azizsancarii TaxID=2961580 RepID=A0ABT4WHC4_9FLAO|nr:hypothetical protein [Flavobacterium azizsancarii]MDA6071861.1 hypothetical protein [Flavobacterium azizsancarii]